MSKDAYKSELFKKRKKNEPITFPWVDELKTSLLYNAYKNIPKEEVGSIRPKDETEANALLMTYLNINPENYGKKDSNSSTTKIPTVGILGTENNEDLGNGDSGDEDTPPKNSSTNVYDDYMKRATDIYNKRVEENRKTAQNQSAIAGAQYREVNRNINEINKANGSAGTGYAGDTTIDAYNAYRNSVNSSYNSAEQANNDLYSYYLSEMRALQQAKENKENADFERDLTNLAVETERENSELEFALSTFKEYADNNLEFNEDTGKITDDSAKKYLTYAIDYYGSIDKIPNKVLLTMFTTTGFSDWFRKYLEENK